MPKAKSTKKEQNVEIVCILDRSGSMEPKMKDAIGGFNSFLKDQKKVKGKAKLTVVLFDHEYIVLDDSKDIRKVSPLSGKDYVPRGTTALHDAMGRAITTVRENIGKYTKANKPTGVIVVTITDGFENASREYNGAKIAALITELRKESWVFLFLAADETAITTAANMGISPNFVAQYTNSSKGVRDAYSVVSRSASKARGMSVNSYTGFDESDIADGSDVKISNNKK